MKYYDYFDIDDEINIAVRAYNDNKNTIEQLKNEISKIQKENAKLDKQINNEKDAILKRKFERQALKFDTFERVKSLHHSIYL